MTYAEFKKQFKITRKSICREIFLRNKDTIRIKKEETVIRNLEKIFGATLKIGNKVGFQAMSMRDLARKAGLSTGALYAYFSGKEDLMRMMQHQRQTIVKRVLGESVSPDAMADEKLAAVIRTHLFLSEAMQPWFYFSYMEAKNLTRALKEIAVSGSRMSEKLIADIIVEGQEKNVFNPHDPVMCASLIKAMLQDWYLNRRKHGKRGMTVDSYADFLLRFVNTFLLPR